jgi:hypothetical protein
MHKSIITRNWKLAKISLGLFVALSFTLSTNIVAKEKVNPSDREMKSEISELTKFHEVVYKIWHTAWPAKDTVMLKDLAPEVDRRGGEVCTAELPGILREKKADWAESTERLKLILAQYKNALLDGNGKELLLAAEKVHSQYESMVRLIRPPLGELEGFHKALYPLYHYFKPQKDREKTLASIVQLKERMKALDSAVLPARLKEKVATFIEAKKKLADAVAVLSEASAATDWAVIDQNIETVHARYEECARIFE